MDWGRAKTILIVSFLLLNMLLSYQLWVNQWYQNASKTDTADMIEEMDKQLAAKNIRLLADVPKETPKLQQITVRFRDEYRTPKQVKLTQPVKLLNVLSRTGLRDIQSKTAIEHFDAYRLDPVTSTDHQYVFHQIYGGLPMFDVTLQLFAVNGEITGYKQTYVEVQSGGEPKEKDAQKVVSAYAVVRSLAENYLNEGAVITDIKLGYHGQLYDSDIQYFPPYWRISVSDREPYYVQAFTGAVEEAKAGREEDSLNRRQR